MSDFDILKQEDRFKYMLLDRMKMDCEYFLGYGYGNRNVKKLWAGNAEEQISTMKALHNSFDEGEKPEWLTMEQIEKYHAEMVAE